MTELDNPNNYIPQSGLEQTVEEEIPPHHKYESLLEADLLTLGILFKDEVFYSKELSPQESDYYDDDFNSEEKVRNILTEIITDYIGNVKTEKKMEDCSIIYNVSTTNLENIIDPNYLKSVKQANLIKEDIEKDGFGKLKYSPISYQKNTLFSDAEYSISDHIVLPSITYKCKVGISRITHGKVYSDDFKDEYGKMAAGNADLKGVGNTPVLKSMEESDINLEITFLIHPTVKAAERANNNTKGIRKTSDGRFAPVCAAYLETATGFYETYQDALEQIKVMDSTSKNYENFGKGADSEIFDLNREFALAKNAIFERYISNNN